MKNLTVLIVACLLILFPVYGQENASVDSVKLKWTEFNSGNASMLKIVWDEEGNRLSKMFGPTSISYGSSPKEAVSRFLDLHGNLLGIDLENDLKLIGESKSGSSKTFCYQQTYKEVPVISSGYVIAVSENGEILYISGDFYPDIEIPIEPLLTSANAVNIVKQYLGISEFDLLMEPTLSISFNSTNKEKYLLGYELVINDKTTTKGFFVDANKPEVITEKSLTSHLTGSVVKNEDTEVIKGSTHSIPEIEIEPNIGIFVTGSGKVYNISPNFGSVVTKTLYNLDSNSPRVLQGTNVEVYKDLWIQCIFIFW